MKETVIPAQPGWRVLTAVAWSGNESEIEVSLNVVAAWYVNEDGDMVPIAKAGSGVLARVDDESENSAVLDILEPGERDPNEEDRNAMARSNWKLKTYIEKEKAKTEVEP